MTTFVFKFLGSNIPLVDELVCAAKEQASACSWAAGLGWGVRYFKEGPPVPPTSAPQLHKHAYLMFVLRHLLMVCMYVLC